jgi:tetratricopeptide (TPR) repeat protein
MKGPRHFKSADSLKSLGRRPKKLESLFNSGLDFLHQGNYQEALDCFQKATKLRPDHEQAYNFLGQVYEAMGRLGSAKQMYKRVLEIDPRHIEAMTRMAQILKREGDYHQAVKVYQKAIEIDPQAAAPRFGLAFLYQHYDMFDEAREAYEALLEKDPAHPLARFYLNRLLFQIGDSPVNSLTMNSKILPAPIF